MINHHHKILLFDCLRSLIWYEPPALVVQA